MVSNWYTSLPCSEPHIATITLSLNYLPHRIPKESWSIRINIRELLGEHVCVYIKREQDHAVPLKLRMRHGVIGEPIRIPKIWNLENLFLVSPWAIRRVGSKGEDPSVPEKFVLGKQDILVTESELIELR